jgi:hypothetical protein
MAKLNKTTAKKVDDAQAGFEPLPAAAYHLRLRDVDADRSGDKGPYWSWEFDVVEPGDYVNRRLWNNTSLSEESLGFFKQTFEAFGVPTDTDTDELLGEVIKGIVSIRTIERGPRKGELANQIDRLVPKDEDFEVPEEANSSEASEQPEAEDIFT